MDLTIAKGLVGLACFIQSQGGDVAFQALSDLNEQQVQIIETLENPCLVIPDDLEIIDEDDEDFEVELAGGEPTMSYKR